MYFQHSSCCLIDFKPKDYYNISVVPVITGNLGTALATASWRIATSFADNCVCRSKSGPDKLSIEP